MCGYARQSLRGLVCLQQTQHTFREPILIYRKVDPNFTTCISNTLSLVWDVLYDDNCHNIHLGNQFSSEKWWTPISRASLRGHTSIFNRKPIRHLSLSSPEGLTLCHYFKLGKILLLPRTIHVMTL